MIKVYESKGQALLVVVFAIAGLLVLATTLAQSSVDVSRRIKLQTVADGAALSAGTIVADGLNAIALSNGIMIGLGIGAFFSDGATLKYIQKIQRFQDEVIKCTPALAMTAAIVHDLSGCKALRLITKRPEMRVKRKYLRFLWVKIPLWCEDSSKTQLRVAKVSLLSLDGNTWETNSASLPRGGRIIGRYIIWPLPAPDFQGYLAKSV